MDTEDKQYKSYLKKYFWGDTSQHPSLCCKTCLLWSSGHSQDTVESSRDVLRPEYFCNIGLTSGFVNPSKLNYSFITRFLR